MAIKTTRIKSSQAPRTFVYDLSDQMNGHRQTFTLPAKVRREQDRYLIFNSTVYRNDANHEFYTLSDDGMSITTYFDEAPKGGAIHALQFVVAENAGESEYVTRAEMNSAIQEAINNLTEGN